MDKCATAWKQAMARNVASYNPPANEQEAVAFWLNLIEQARELCSFFGFSNQAEGEQMYMVARYALKNMHISEGDIPSLY